ncbi:hypothetical protein LCGC14_0731930 [marine sediment metagenome]|uniref:Uncharacterized protein n=1 Tax=marine sediment metagenome TaxID=412755 RepID=A0A0F9QU82_9ZZZZ
MENKYYYFISFAQQTKNTTGFSWRILGFDKIVTIMDLQEALEKHNPEFNTISIINFKLIDKKQVGKE